MKGFRKQRNNVARVFGLRILTVLLVVGVFAISKAAWDMLESWKTARDKRIEAQAQLVELEGLEKDLRTEIANLKDPHGVETALREQFDVAREGEGVIVIVDRPDGDMEENGEKKEPWWRKLVDSF